MKTTFRAWCCALVAILSITSAGAAVEVEPAFYTLPSTAMLGISADGHTAVGGYGALRWTPPDAPQTLDHAYPIGFALAASSDASVLTGHVSQPVDGDRLPEAFRWTEAGGYQLLGPVGGYEQSMAQDISGDGSIVVGNLIASGGNYTAFSWSASGLELLESLPNAGTPEDSPSAFAEGISADGTVIVGGSRIEGGERVAVRWDSGQITSLGDLPGGDVDSYAEGISADNSVIVGTATTDRGSEGFRWTEAEGMVSLWPLTAAFDASADGSVIIGVGAVDGGPSEALIWDAEHGARSLYRLLSQHREEASGWRFGTVEGISDNGLVVVGIANAPNDGPHYGFMATVPEPSSTILLAIGFVGLVCGARVRNAIVR